MNRWLHRIGTGALVLTLVGTLANCGGGGGGGNDRAVELIRLFFGMNGDGTCSSVVVNVDLADADAILARKNDGTVDCALDIILAANGCHATFAELNNGEQLRVSISGCIIPAVTNLFVCGFEDVDISDLVTESSAQCTCSVPGCDNTPPLCIDQDLDPRSCEDCDNGRDDDGNGLSDCDDPNCEHSPDCADTTTTTTTTLENTTTTTEAVTTTTTLPPEPMLINFALASSNRPLGALRFTANYTSAPGNFVGNGALVECENALAGADFTADNKNTIRKLTLDWALVSGFGAPNALASCVFMPGTPVPVPANFTIVINDAIDTSGVSNVKVNVAVTVTPIP